MRKILLSALFAASVTSGAFAQKLDDVQEKISKGKYDEAKEKIDKVLADPKNQTNANAWYYKGKVYAELARQDSAGTLTYNAGKEAFDAFRKYQELDKKNIMMTLDQNVGLFQLYDLYYNQGIKKYNAKSYEDAFQKMQSALEVEEYIQKKGYSYNNFSFPVLDTQLINLTASSAYLAKKEDDAVRYFERLADARVKDKEFKEVYGLLSEYYLKKKDMAKADKYLTLGKQFYPDNDYWIGLEFGNPGDDKEKKLARYEEMTQKYPDNFPLIIDYAIEQFNYTYNNDKKPADYKARMDKSQKLLEKALSLDPNSALANYVMSQHIYNQIFDFDDEIRAIKTNTPADQAKRKDINARENAKYEELLTYSQKAFDLYSKEEATMKAHDKANYRKAINQLIDYYTRKKQNDKVAFYQDKLKGLK